MLSAFHQTKGKFQIANIQNFGGEAGAITGMAAKLLFIIIK
jgi:hypothetical protein